MARPAARRRPGRMCAAARQLVRGRTGNQGRKVRGGTETAARGQWLQLRSCENAAAQLRPGWTSVPSEGLFPCGGAHFIAPRRGCCWHVHVRPGTKRSRLAQRSVGERWWSDKGESGRGRAEGPLPRSARRRPRGRAGPRADSSVRGGPVQAYTLPGRRWAPGRKSRLGKVGKRRGGGERVKKCGWRKHSGRCSPGAVLAFSLTFTPSRPMVIGTPSFQESPP